MSARNLILAISLVFLTSCSLFSRGEEAAPPEATSQPSLSNWYRVDGDSLVYFPVGIERDHPTDAFNGEWVQGGADGSRFFIPKGGTTERSHTSLYEEACALRGEPAGGSMLGGTTDTIGAAGAKTGAMIGAVGSKAVSFSRGMWSGIKGAIPGGGKGDSEDDSASGEAAADPAPEESPAATP